MKKLFQLSLVVPFLCFGLFTVSSVKAQTATTSADDQTIQDNIKDRVEKIMKTNPTVEGIETSQEKNFGVTGTLEKMVGATLQVRSFGGEIRVIELDKQAVILKDQKLITREELELNAWIVVMGTIDPTQGRIGKRILITTSNLVPTKRQTIVGTVAGLTTKSISLLGTDSLSQTPPSYPVSTKTTYFNILSQSMKRTDIKTNDKVLLILPDSTDTATAVKRIYDLSPKI